jgi:transcriptional regulator with GAF, ATPase, and Fis domain
MQWKQWDDAHGTCYSSGAYVITQRSGGAWLLEGHGLSERGYDLELLKIAAEDHAQRHARVAVGAGAPVPPTPPAPVDTSEYPGDVRELSRVVKRLSRVGLAANPYENRAIAMSREALEMARDDLQRIIDRLP